MAAGLGTTGRSPGAGALAVNVVSDYMPRALVEAHAGGEDQIVELFGRYLARQGLTVAAQEMEANVAQKLGERLFTGDIGPLLRIGETFDVTAAAEAADREAKVSDGSRRPAPTLLSRFDSSCGAATSHLDERRF